MEKINLPFVQLAIPTDFWNGLCTNDGVPLYFDCLTNLSHLLDNDFSKLIRLFDGRKKNTKHKQTSAA